jgi:hypothetical protein
MATPSPVIIPTRTDIYCYTLGVELAGVLFNLRFYWNGRLKMWIMDIRDANQNDILLGIPVVGDYPLNYWAVGGRIPGSPNGIIMSLDSTGKKRDPDLDTFGKDVVLMFFPAA